MKTIGLLGGMSWESTGEYYRLINEGVKQALGGLHSAEIVLYSVDFEPIETLQRRADWITAANLLSDAARKVESSGADFLLICTNTMHKVALEIEQSIEVPLVHIADATAEVLQRQGLLKVGLLGTAFTMEEDFYKGRLRHQHGIDVIVPSPSERRIVHEIIYNELCLGTFKGESREKYLEIINSLENRGADAIILGCTEIGMLVDQEHTDVPLIDTTAVHADKAVRMAIGERCL